MEEEDIPLHNLFNTSTLKKDNTPFKVFTPFKNHCLKNLDVRKPDSFNEFKFIDCKTLKVIE